MNPDIIAEEALSMIRNILYPGGDLDHEWNVSDLEKIAAVVDLYYKQG